eukprot:5869222-Pleurochrysis_carterae.AAC.1
MRALLTRGKAKELRTACATAFMRDLRLTDACVTDSFTTGASVIDADICVADACATDAFGRANFRRDSCAPGVCMCICDTVHAQ